MAAANTIATSKALRLLGGGLGTVGWVGSAADWGSKVCGLSGRTDGSIGKVTGGVEGSDESLALPGEPAVLIVSSFTAESIGRVGLGSGDGLSVAEAASGFNGSFGSTAMLVDYLPAIIL